MGEGGGTIIDFPYTLFKNELNFFFWGKNGTEKNFPYTVFKN